MNYWTIIPAAGAGRRMGGEIPKQYLPLGGKTVIQHTLDCLLDHPQVKGAVVALAKNDGWWDKLQLNYSKPILRADGGKERSDSVMNALERLSSEADREDYVLVHDAVRPCVRHGDLDRLLDIVKNDPAGGILARPSHDTMKRGDVNCRIDSTVDRRFLWHALTPQMFQLGPLIQAIRYARKSDLAITDEASAMELLGSRPQLVAGHTDNIKITRPEDLPLAEFFLRQQQRI